MKENPEVLGEGDEGLGWYTDARHGVDGVVIELDVDQWTIR